MNRYVWGTRPRNRSNKSVLRERKPPPMPECQPKVTRDSNPDFVIRMRIWMSARWLPKRCGFITLSAWVISTSVVKMGRWVLEWDDRQNGRQHRSHNYQCGGGKTHCSLTTIIMKTLLSTYDKLGLETKNSSASIFALKSWSHTLVILCH